MLDTPLVTTARSIKSFLIRIKANALLSFSQSIYHSVFLKDNGKNFIRKRINDEVYKFVPNLAVFADNYDPHILLWLKSVVCAQNGVTITFSLIKDRLSPCNSLMFSVSINGDAPKVSRDVTVPAISLDGLLAKQKRSPNLVKIDVEGSELKLIKDAKKLLSSQSAPILLLAIHPFWLEALEDCQEIVSLLTQWGYQIFNHNGENVEMVEYDEYLCLPPRL